jgi:hypothetical protein
MSLSKDTSLDMVGKNTKVKIEGAHVSCYVDPLYGTKPNIIFDKKIELLHRSFWEKCGISNEKIVPKRLKIRKDIKKKEVVTLFGPCSHNGYKYCHNEDQVLIIKVVTLCMIMHQRTHLPNIQRINKVEAQGIVYEIKTCKKMN